MQPYSEEKYIRTELGSVFVKIERGDDLPPLIFLHGVFLDHTLWSAFGSELTGRTHIYLDMPSHGNSQMVGRDWTLDECVDMLIDCLDALNIDQCIAIGHSWGSMTIMRAAVKHPERFLSLGLFNMPYRSTTGMARIGFTLQKSLVYLPRFYGKQAAKSLYTADFLKNHPDIIIDLQVGMQKRRPVETARTLDAVILSVEDATRLIQSLQVPALSIVGVEDYVGQTPYLDTRVVPGGHITPHEAPAETERAIQDVILMAKPQPSRSLTL